MVRTQFKVPDKIADIQSNGDIFFNKIIYPRGGIVDPVILLHAIILYVGVRITDVSLQVSGQFFI